MHSVCKFEVQIMHPVTAASAASNKQKGGNTALDLAVTVLRGSSAEYLDELLYFFWDHISMKNFQGNPNARHKDEVPRDWHGIVENLVAQSRNGSCAGFECKAELGTDVRSCVMFRTFQQDRLMVFHACGRCHCI
jgi:hypothetical protein